MKYSLLLAAATAVSSTAFDGATVDPHNLPHTSEKGQYGPTIGDSERYEVAWCTKAGHGARLIPAGALKSVHYQKTSKYIQITGTGDFTKMNIPRGDEGGELDPHGADGSGNPIGAVVLSSQFGGLKQIQEWLSFLSDTEFCIRACNPSDSDAWKCCAAETVAMPPGEYKLKNGQTSTWHQGVDPTPAGQKPAKSSNCVKQATIAAAAYPRKVKTTSKPKPKPTTTKKATTTHKKTTTYKEKIATTHKKKPAPTKKH
ncbi:macrofage activating glycoprotein [Rhodotorula toruloides]|uniref:Macrofage activating glycoprotein n=1 Tax=Rhodotorula toruloides TaxID=5286 RepID=A0A511KBF7_RHOTO|nr:macrofage activating glycoprotein [Rhodotorula toruloides]